MNPRTLLSIASRVFSRAASRNPILLALGVLCAAALSFAQTAPLSMTISGPYAFKDTPAVASYQLTVTNSSQAILSNISLSNALSSTDGAYLIAAQPSQGTCDPGGQGITTLNCFVGSLDPGASVLVNIAAQMVSGTMTLSSSASGLDANSAQVSAGPVQRDTAHGNPPAGTSIVSISLSANPTPKDLVGGRTGMLNWTLQNSTGARANKLTFAMVIDNRMSISSSSVTGSNAGDPVSCGTPLPGAPGTNIVFCNIDYLGGSSGGSGSTATVTQLQVIVNYRSPIVSSQTTLLATGYLSFDGTDSSNPAATGQVRVK
jgi:Domain of unknown function DUF11